jgi:hypothetical protein
MNETNKPITEEVTDAELEFVERLLFDELHDLHQKKQSGVDVLEDIIQVESALESITIIRNALSDAEEQDIELTAAKVQEILSN